MGCNSCGIFSSPSYTNKTVCIVCREMDGDNSIKSTAHCSICGGGICQSCFVSGRRVKAATKVTGRKFINALGQWVDEVKEIFTKE